MECAYPEYIKLTVVVCYAPHSQHDANETDYFYQHLQAAVETVPTHDMLLILGDLNAQTGRDTRGKERYMGKHGMGQLNDNGEKLIGLCERESFLRWQIFKEIIIYGLPVDLLPYNFFLVYGCQIYFINIENNLIQYILNVFQIH